MSTPNPCGCCCSLKTGGKVIATLDIIGGIITVVIYTLVIITIAITPSENTEKKICGHDSCSRFSNDLLNGDSNRGEKKDVTVKPYEYALSSILLVIGLITIALGVSLFQAVKKKSEYPMKIWIICRIVVFMANNICNVLKYILDFSALLLFHDVFAVTITLWFIAVIYYLRQELTAVNINTRTSMEVIKSLTV